MPTHRDVSCNVVPPYFILIQTLTQSTIKLRGGLSYNPIKNRSQNMLFLSDNRSYSTFSLQRLIYITYFDEVCITQEDYELMKTLHVRLIYES